MHMLANIGPGEFGLIPQPGIRKIAFEEDPNQFTVAHLLVHNWALDREGQECTSPPDGDFKVHARRIGEFNREQKESLPQTTETSEVHTPWRDQVYYTWNHVFFDVGNWMANMYGTATFRPPNTDAFGVEFPEDGKEVVEMTWESDTLLAAAYLAPGVSVRLETITPGREGEEPFHASDLDDESRYMVWYVRGGVKVRFCVVGERQDLEGLAAAVVFGNMLGEPMEPAPSSDEEDEEEEEENDDGDGGIPSVMAALAYQSARLKAQDMLPSTSS